ncbi:efflux transporter outer membrane subunit [Segetibacter koreensis]|uniref:efflux transporter outer membrane subunit n=1 Tax=Segetibacter koreensis TaxID=398037 RepID=UPI00036CE4A6|nr:efflux transporter outer membrane subunit [Segetibacter koreensis]
MNKQVITYLMIFLLSALIISSCKVTQTYQPPALSTAGLFRDSSSSDTSNIANLHWNDVFTDTALQTLIAEGISRNFNLQIAYNRIQQAEAYYAQSRAAFYPTLNANAQVTESKLSAVQGFGIRNSSTQYQLGLSSSWEANIWGRLSSAKRAGLASLLQSQSASRAVQTGLIASIANYYYSLLALDKQLGITQQTVQNWDTTVTTMRALKEAAVVTGAAVVQSEASRYAAEVTIPDLKQNIREIENALSILLGRPPGIINRSNIDDQTPVVLLQTGVPAQLLSNRPDVQEAEYNFRYSFEQTNIARTYFYPSLMITGAGGLSSLSLGKFFNSGSVFGSIAAGLTQPIFNARANRTRLEVARVQQQEALFSFQNTLLTAGQEVSDAMSLYQTAMDKMMVRTKQLNALQKSVEYSRELLRYGSANYIEVIQARQSLLGAELSRVNDHLQQLQAIVNLYRALGGGWK